MGVNMNLIERAVVFAAKIVRTLSDSAVDAGILSFAHGNKLLSRIRTAQYHRNLIITRFPRNIHSDAS